MTNSAPLPQPPVRSSSPVSGHRASSPTTGVRFLPVSAPPQPPACVPPRVFHAALTRPRAPSSRRTTLGSVCHPHVPSRPTASRHRPALLYHCSAPRRILTLQASQHTSAPPPTAPAPPAAKTYRQVKQFACGRSNKLLQFRRL